MSSANRGRERMSRKMPEVGYVQVGDGDEVGRCSEAARGALDQLQQTDQGREEPSAGKPHARIWAGVLRS